MQNRCSYCYKRGHNRTTCPERLEKVQELRVQASLGGELNYNERALIEEEERRAQRKVTRSKTRKCSYCSNRHYRHEYDHNRRNCPQMAADRDLIVERNKAFRAQVLPLAKEKGLAPGALFMMSDKSYLITEVDWDCIVCLDYRDKFYGDFHQFQVVPIDSYADGTKRIRRLRLSDILGDRVKMLVKSTDRVVERSLSESWRSGDTGLDFYFRKDMDKHFY